MFKKVAKILYLCAIFLFISCSKEEIIPVPIIAEATQFLNEVYGNDEKQRYDIYLPEGRTTNTPVIILVHGGFWSGGDKSEMNELITLSLSSWNDYAIVNANYRLLSSTSNQHPAQLNDLSSLIDALESKKSAYQISNNYFMIGVSAGGHLSLLYAYLTDVNHKVKAVCSIVGPTDFTDPAYTDSGSVEFEAIATWFLGESYENNPDLYIDASPLTHVDPTDPPTILFYGGNDVLIPISQPARLRDMLESSGVVVAYTLYPDSGHDLSGADYIDISSKVKLFFDQYK